MRDIETLVNKYMAKNNFTECSHPNCFEETIYSHSISKSISLKTIAEKDHLVFFKPRRFKSIKKPKFETIDVNQCSAFNGFCKEHDDMFQDIDLNKITTSEHLKLQVFRTLCCELNKEKVGVEFLQEPTDEEAIKLLVSRGVIEDASEVIGNFIELSKKKIKFLQRESFEDRLYKIERLVVYFYRILKFGDLFRFDTNEKTVFATDNLNTQVLYYMTDFLISVAVSTKVTYDIDQGMDYYLIVIPYEDSTLIMCIVPDGSPIIVQEKINESFKSKLSIIKFVESIISSCDGWYIKPSVIYNMTEDKKYFFK